jgi:hypothetical protein
VSVTRRLPAGLEAQLRLVECAPARTGRRHDSKTWHFQPVRLWPLDIFPDTSIKKDYAQAWWVTFKAADDLKPGTYPVKIAVKSEGRDIMTFRIEVEILPFKLPKTTDIDYAWGVYTARFLPESMVKDIADHGLNSLSSFSNMPRGKAGAIDYKEWDEYFVLLKKHDVFHSYAWYLGAKNYGYPVREHFGVKGVAEILKAMNERVKDGRYPKNFCVTIDEAVCRNDQFNNLKQLFQQTKDNAPLLKRFGVALNRFNWTQKHQGIIDILSCNGNFIENSAWCKKNGYGMYTYSGIFSRLTPGSVRYNMGFFPWRHNATGTYGWAYTWNNGDPYDDMDSWGSDWCAMFPTWSGGQPIASPAWEGFREGIDDRRYIEVLKTFIKEGKASAGILEEVKKTAKEDGMQNEARVGISVFQAFIGNENAEKLNKARDLVIDGILKALKK